MNPWMIVIVAGVVLVIAGGLARAHIRKKMIGVGLESRAQRLKRLAMHGVSPEDHRRFAQRWHALQTSFLDDPAASVEKAEQLVEEVLRAQGYPVIDFDQRAAEISVDHPHFVEEFSAARRLAGAGQTVVARTEAMRQATIQFRALFEELLAAKAGPPTETARPVGARRERNLVGSR